jgi:hypothetical protein
LGVGGCVSIIARDLNNGSFDNCTVSGNLLFYFNADRADTLHTFCCSDFVNAGANFQLHVNIELWVEDEQGNADFCEVQLVIYDTQNECPLTICNPDDEAPSFLECPSDVTFVIPTGACVTPVTWALPLLEADDCSIVNVISSASFFTFHSGPGDGTNGQFIIHGNADSITIVGTTNGTPGNGNNRFNVCFYATCTGRMSFNWHARTNNGDGFINDRARITITHAIHEANVNADLTTGDDTISIGILQATQLLAGDRVCIDVQSDNTDGVDSITLTDFLFVADTLPVIQTLGPEPGDSLPQGTYPVQYTITDCAGNTAYCDFTVTVLAPDPMDLIANCPQDFTIQLPSASICDTLLSFAIPTVASCDTVNGFIQEMNPFILGVQLTEEAEAGMGDNIIGTDGWVYVTPDKDSLILLGTNNGTYGTPRNDTSVITVCVAPRCPGTISFDWSASVGRFNDFLRDEAGIIFNGKDSILSAPQSAEYAAGSVSFQADGINPLCFYVRSTNFLSEDTFTITNFSYIPVASQLIEVDTFDISQPLGPGVYDFRFEARDCFGNTDTCEFSATIIGNVPGSLACKNLNISLDANCQALITPDMIVAGICTAGMTVELSHYGIPIPNPVDSHYLWKHITATLIDTLSGNSCWGDLYIEDKLAPVIVCRADTTDCYSFNFDFPSDYSGTDCSAYTVTTLDERIEHLYCNDFFLKAVYRDIQIKDVTGITDVCTDTIFVRRITADDITLPEGQLDFSCDRPLTLDANGNPSPLVTGIPFFYTYTGNFVSVWPLNLLLDCNLLIQYEDIDLGEINCVRKIMRTWTVREWWCGNEITRTRLQLLLIHDISGPIITHAPYGFDVTTGRRDCNARVQLPPIEAFDYCHGPVRVDIAYPGGILLNQNGGVVDLPGGQDTIFYRVYDACFNLTEFFIIINVHDETEPVAVCDRNTVVGLNHNGYSWVPAEVFDDGSFDECAIHHFEVRRMDTDFCGGRGADDWSPEVGFCCDDVGNMVMVALKVVDVSGNEAICMVNVEVQDKDRPLITCLPNITVDCRFDIDLTHLEVFGKIVADKADRDTIIIDPRYYHVIGGHPQDGFAADNCPPTIIGTVDGSNLNQCGIGYIIRIFQAIDHQGNTSDICYQYITVVNHDTFDINDITWPLDLDTVDICDPGWLLPERLDSIYSKPVVSDDECSLIGVSYSDVLYSPTSPGGACYKIIRTWSVIDWCQRDINGNIVVWTHDQILRARNSRGPSILRISPDTVICSYDLNCRPIPVSFSIEATDDCTEIIFISFTYKIDFNSDGTFDVIHTAIGDPTASGTWPLGRHTVKWEIEDRCGNTAIGHFILDLQNCKPPVAYCLNGLSTNLTPMDWNGDGIPDIAMDTVWAKDFDAGSYHNCGYYVALSFSADTADKFRVYDCDSIGTRIVELWVTDINGNTSFCRTFIDVQDNSNFCPNSTTNSNVLGFVANEKNDGVQNVSMELLNSGMNNIMTDYQGKYTFMQIPNGQVITVIPSKTDGWLNGVTTADIVKIQRHILGIELLKTPYKLIAADVNKSQTITARDVSDLRKLILGITREINGNTSWRFVHQLYSFNNLNTVLTQPFPESYQINPLTSDMNLDFYGIKTGDVNASAVTKGFNNNNVARNKNILEIETDESLIKKDQIREIEFRVANGSLYNGMQFTLEWNVDLADLISVHSNEVMKIKEDNYSLGRKDEGKLSFSWNGEMNNGDWILKLQMKAKQSVKVSECLHISSSVTPSLSVSKDNDEDAGIALRFAGMEVDNFDVMQNEPNPWNHQTTIGIMLPQSGEVNITVYDVNGKVYLMDQVQMNKGYNEYILNESQMDHAGLYYYQVDYLTHTLTHKMLIAK